jgi:hypothetical protein
MWPEFVENEQVTTAMTGFLYIPGKILVGYCQKTSGKDLPFVCLMKNSWLGYAKTRELCDLAFRARGAPFKEASSQGCNGSTKVKTGTIKGSFSEQPLTAHYVSLDT